MVNSPSKLFGAPPDKIPRTEHCSSAPSEVHTETAVTKPFHLITGLSEQFELGGLAMTGEEKPAEQFRWNTSRPWKAPT